MQEEKQMSKWQPVVLILDRRLDCTTCGAAAVFVTAKIAEKDHNILENADTWCQACFNRAQLEAEETV